MTEHAIDAQQREALETRSELDADGWANYHHIPPHKNGATADDKGEDESDDAPEFSLVTGTYRTKKQFHHPDSSGRHSRHPLCFTLMSWQQR